MNILCFICGLLGHTEKQCLKLYDCPSGEVVKGYGHWMKAPNKRSQMNSDEKWLRSEMPNEFNNGKGNNVNFAGMAIDSVISTNPGDHVLKIRDYSVNTGIAGINKESSILLPNRSHLRINDKSTMGITNDLCGSKDFEEEQEAGIIVNDSKRRRSQVGPRSTVGLNDESSTQVMDISVELKNGQTVGLVT